MGCEGSRCLVGTMASVSQFAYGVATNGKAVFFPAFNDNGNGIFHTNIYRVEFDGTPGTKWQSLTDFQGRVFALAVDCENVYFAIDNGAGPPTIRYVRADAYDADPMDFVSGLVAEAVDAIAVDGEFVYWVANAGDAGVKAWRKGGAVETVANGTSGHFITGLAIRDGYVYWASQSGMPMDGKISRAKIPAKGVAWSPETVRSNAGRPQGLAVDDDSVYWVDLNAVVQMPKLRKASREFSLVPDIPLANVQMPQPPNFPATWLAVDDEYVYFIDSPGSGGAVIARSNKKIASKEIIADNQNSAQPFSAHALVADGERVYFSAPASGSDSRIMWVSK